MDVEKILEEPQEQEQEQVESSCETCSDFGNMGLAVMLEQLLTVTDDEGTKTVGMFIKDMSEHMGYMTIAIIKLSEQVGELLTELKKKQRI